VCKLALRLGGELGDLDWCLVMNWATSVDEDSSLAMSHSRRFELGDEPATANAHNIVVAIDVSEESCCH
jgi:hypothetical protein